MSYDWRHECFKNIIIDLITNRVDRPLPDLIPSTVDVDASVDEFIKLYHCPKPNQGRFIITRFVVYEQEKKIALEWENVSQSISTVEYGGTAVDYVDGSSRGGGAVVGYDYDGTTVTYQRCFNMFVV